MTDIAVAPFETGLQEWFASARARADGFGEHYAALWEKLEQAGSGGKRQRPALVLAAYSGLGGAPTRAAADLGIAFELLHTAFIIHDDVIDHDEVRRGEANVAGAFRMRAIAHGADDAAAGVWGEAAALLAGDLALSQAHRIIARLEAPDDVRGRLLDILDEAVFVSAAGELADVTGSVTASTAASGVSDVLTTLERKTAVYSFVAPLQAGAVLAGAVEPHIDALGRFGRLAGVAYQLADDLLGVFGDESVTGKSALADLREGKRTTLIAHAAGTPAWPLIAAGLGDPRLTEADAQRMRVLLEECGARAATLAMAQEHVALAQAELAASDLPAALVEELSAVAGKAGARLR